MKKLYFFALAAIFFTSSLIAQERSIYNFIALSDMHVATVTSAVNNCDLNGEEAKCYLHYFASLNPKPAFIIASGDISNIGNSSTAGGMYSALTQYLYPHPIVNPGVGAYYIDAAKTIPFYFAPGNHDYYTTLLPPGTLTQLDTLTNYSHNIAPDTDYAIINGSAVLLFVRSGNDISYAISTDPKGSGLTNEQCTWIRRVLLANSTKRKIIIMHHPAANHTGYNCNGDTHSALADSLTATMYVNRNTFVNICDSNHVDVVLAGHSHQNVVVNKHGQIISENCSNCGTRYVQTGPAFNGCYRQITVSSGFISVSPPMQGCPGGIDTTSTVIIDTIPTPVDTTTTTNLNDAENELNISIYPDPSNGLFTLSLGQPLQARLKIYNALGQCVYQQPTTTTASNSNIQIDLRNQPNGMYFLQLIPDEGETITYNFKYSLVINK